MVTHIYLKNQTQEAAFPPRFKGRGIHACHIDEYLEDDSLNEYAAYQTNLRECIGQLKFSKFS